MVRVKWRWLLPLGHLLVDCVLLVALIAHSNHLLRRDKGALHRPTHIQSALFLQEGIPFEPTNIRLSGPSLLITSGNLPAGIVSEFLRPPHDRIVRSGQRLDGVWFLLHESCAFVCWHFIGVWVDVGRMRLRWVMIGYLAMRLLLALTGAYEVGMRIQVLFWFCFMFYLIFVGTSLLVRFGLRAAKRT
jgi:hypothetical protein